MKWTEVRQEEYDKSAHDSMLLFLKCIWSRLPFLFWASSWISMTKNEKDVVKTPNVKCSQCGLSLGLSFKMVKNWSSVQCDWSGYFHLNTKPCIKRDQFTNFVRIIFYVSLYKFIKRADILLNQPRIIPYLSFDWWKSLLGTMTHPWMWRLTNG